MPGVKLFCPEPVGLWPPMQGMNHALHLDLRRVRSYTLGLAMNPNKVSGSWWAREDSNLHDLAVAGS